MLHAGDSSSLLPLVFLDRSSADRIGSAPSTRCPASRPRRDPSRASSRDLLVAWGRIVGRQGSRWREGPRHSGSFPPGARERHRKVGRESVQQPALHRPRRAAAVQADEVVRPDAGRRFSSGRCSGAPPGHRRRRAGAPSAGGL
jgi:hypothetical protein